MAFTLSEVYTTLMKISDSDLHLLGLSDEYAHPEWMILTVLPVPPPPFGQVSQWSPVLSDFKDLHPFPARQTHSACSE